MRDEVTHEPLFTKFIILRINPALLTKARKHQLWEHIREQRHTRQTSNWLSLPPSWKALCGHKQPLLHLC